MDTCDECTVDPITPDARRERDGPDAVLHLSEPSPPQDARATQAARRRADRLGRHIRSDLDSDLGNILGDWAAFTDPRGPTVGPAAEKLRRRRQRGK